MAREVYVAAGHTNQRYRFTIAHRAAASRQ